MAPNLITLEKICFNWVIEIGLGHASVSPHDIKPNITPIGVLKAESNFSFPFIVWLFEVGEKLMFMFQ